MSAYGEIYVGKLPYDVDEATLRDLFEPYGEVASITLIRDTSGASRGFGFVKMPLECVQDAVDGLDGHEFDGEPIRVNISRDKGARAPRREY